MTSTSTRPWTKRPRGTRKKKQMIRTDWIDAAQCRGQNPQAYELDDYRGDRDARAVELCAGCPVTRECAAAALDPLAVGTVRGGVWITDSPRTGTRAITRRRLQAIALGVE